MRAVLVIVALILPVIAVALPDDATLSRLLVGTAGARHETVDRADGTWLLDPPDEGDNTRGKWRIEHGKLIELGDLATSLRIRHRLKKSSSSASIAFKSRIDFTGRPR